MKILKKLLPLLLFFVIAVLTINFRYIPKGKIWDGYKILYVQKDSSVKEIEQVLAESGIPEYVSLAGQRIPIMLNKNSPEETMLKLNINKAENSYLYERQNFFYDSQKQYSIYYIPEQYDRHISQALSLLKDRGIKAGADTTLPYLWLLPVITLIIFTVLLIFSKNKLFFTFSGIMPCVYCFCNAFYSCAIAVFILLLCTFVISNIYGRKGAVKKLLNNYILIAALVISVVLAFSAGFTPGLFYLLSVAACCMAYFIAAEYKRFSLRKTDFAPVLIRPARRISIYAGKTNIIMPCLLAACVIVIAYFSLSSLSLTGVKSDSKVLLPGATAAADADSRLPDFEKFYRWNWNVLTSPYKSLNENSEYDENHIVYPRYEVTDGKIERKNMMMYYDDTFRKRIYDGIDSLDFYSIESVIKGQGKDFFAGYTRPGSYNISIFSIIMMITGFCVLLFIYFSAMIGKGGKK